MSSLTFAALRMSSLSWNPEWPLRFMSNHEFMKEPPNMVTGHRHAVGQNICEKSHLLKLDSSLKQ